MENFEYYYNNVPGIGKTRNNLVYTSFINQEKTIFQQWYYNDEGYHGGMNEVLDPSLMTVKWEREVKFLTMMKENYPHLVPEILDIDYSHRKIFLRIQGVDFWQRSLDKDNCSFDEILPDWQNQMLEIIQAHKNLGIYKYSMHPSSYFIVDGKLKSINYFFCYTEEDGPLTVREHLSHISENRRKVLFQQMADMNIDVDEKVPLKNLQMLAFESFKTNYPDNVMEKAKAIYV